MLFGAADNIGGGGISWGVGLARDISCFKLTAQFVTQIRGVAAKFRRSRLHHAVHFYTLTRVHIDMSPLFSPLSMERFLVRKSALQSPVQHLVERLSVADGTRRHSEWLLPKLTMKFWAHQSHVQRYTGANFPRRFL